MFENHEQTFVVPYGAFELKATYQRNMLIAMGMVTVLVLSILMSALIYSHFNQPIMIEIEPIKDIRGSIDLPSVKFKVPKTPDFNTGSRREVIAESRTPTPVADSFFASDELTSIATIDEKALMTGSGNGPITCEETDFNFAGGDGNYGISEEITPSTFIKVETPPVMIQEHTPQYPRFCEAAGITGTVWIWALVDIDGKVLRAKVVKSSDTPALDDAALEAAYKNIFKPGIQNNRPIQVGVTYRVEFVLDD